MTQYGIPVDPERLTMHREALRMVARSGGVLDYCEAVRRLEALHDEPHATAAPPPSAAVAFGSGRPREGDLLRVYINGGPAIPAR